MCAQLQQYEKSIKLFEEVSCIYVCIAHACAHTLTHTRIHTHTYTGQPTGGGQLGHFALGPTLLGVQEDRYTLIEQSSHGEGTLLCLSLGPLNSLGGPAHTHTHTHTRTKQHLDSKNVYSPLQVGIASMENRLLQYGAKEFFFKAVICHFCMDASKAEVSIVQTPHMSVHTIL